MIPKELLQKYSVADKEFYDDDMLFYQTYLIQTDHIPAKLFEDFIETMTSGSVNIGSMIKFFKEVKTEYADVLAARKTAREEINRIESEMAK